VGEILDVIDLDALDVTNLLSYLLLFGLQLANAVLAVFQKKSFMEHILLFTLLDDVGAFVPIPFDVLLAVQLH
jgi:hypothetical protein